MKRRAMLAFGLAALAVTTSAVAKAPSTWDGLVEVKSKRFQLVYLQPGADFRSYSKVMIDPTEVAFEKNWMREHNSGLRGGGRITERDMQQAISEAVVAAGEIFASAWTKGGYTVVTAPGPDVLRVRTGVMDVRVNAPDKMQAGRTYGFAPEAGSAVLFVEARDSMTGALLGRAVDKRFAGDSGPARRTRISNRGDFRDLVEEWASAGVRGMDELKTLSPIRQ